MSSQLRDYCKQLKLKNIVEIYEEVSYETKEQYLVNGIIRIPYYGQIKTDDYGRLRIPGYGGDDPLPL